jgi:hypothetical protein
MFLTEELVDGVRGSSAVDGAGIPATLAAMGLGSPPGH